MTAKKKPAPKKQPTVIRQQGDPNPGPIAKQGQPKLKRNAPHLNRPKKRTPQPKPGPKIEDVELPEKFPETPIYDAVAEKLGWDPIKHTGTPRRGGDVEH